MAVELRDIRCGNDVAQMAALGKFDHEFTVYGCAYRKDGETNFRISENFDTIYRFWERAQKQGIYATKIISHSQLTGVPSGLEDEIWEEERWNLANILADSYTDPFLDTLNDLGRTQSLNWASTGLLQWKEAIEGRFRRDLQKAFDTILEYCFVIKQLDKKTYEELTNWSNTVWRQMEDDLIVKDIFERSLYGYLVEENGMVKAIFDAQFPTVYRHWIEDILKGRLVTPIFSETLWFRSFMEFSKKKTIFADHMHTLLEPHLPFLRELASGESFVNRELFNTYFERVKAENKPYAVETMELYGRLWHCI